MGKALGIGIIGFVWREIEVLSGGKPRVALHGHVAEIARRLGVTRVELSLSHTAGMAYAVAVAVMRLCEYHRATRRRRMTMLESLSVGLLTAEKMRATDAAAIEGLGIPGGHLMERAGAAVARELMLAFEPESVVVYAGKGNNGGDGFVVARELFNAGVEVTVFAIAGRDAYRGDAKLNLDIAERLGIEIVDGVEPRSATPTSRSTPSSAPASPARPRARRGGHRRDERLGGGGRRARHRRGVDASTGEVAGPAVLADLTVTLHAAQGGPLREPRRPLRGRRRGRAHRHPAGLRRASPTS